MTQEALGEQCTRPAPNQTAKMQGIFLDAPTIIPCGRFVQRVDDKGEGAGNEIEADNNPGTHVHPTKASVRQIFQLFLYFQPAHLGMLDIIGKLRLTLEQAFQ